MTLTLFSTHTFCHVLLVLHWPTRQHTLKCCEGPDKKVQTYLQRVNCRESVQWAATECASVWLCGSASAHTNKTEGEKWKPLILLAHALHLTPIHCPPPLSPPPASTALWPSFLLLTFKHLNNTFRVNLNACLWCSSENSHGKPTTGNTAVRRDIFALRDCFKTSNR